MTIQALVSELATDPLARGYAAMDDTAAAASLNEVNRPSTKKVPHTKYLRWLAVEGRRVDIETGATSQGNKAAKGICLLARDLIQMTEVDYDRAVHKPLLLALQAVGVIDAAAVAELDDQADTVVSRAAELKLGRVRTGDVTRARL